MALKLYKNLRGQAFTIRIGTGRPGYPVNGTPRVWIHDDIAKRYPEWFEEVPVDEPKPVRVEAVEPQASEIAELVDVAAVMADADRVRVKGALAEFGARYGIELDESKTMADMKLVLRAELEALNSL